MKRLLTLLSLCILFGARQTNTTMRPLLAKVASLAWAGGAVAHSAHYWHNQYKPFKDDAERDAILKDMILNQSAFTGSWTPEMREEFRQNPELFKIREGDFLLMGVGPEAEQTILSIDSKLFKNANNRAITKKVIQEHSSVLGHEGTHVAQGLKNIHLNTGYPIVKHVATQATATLFPPVFIDEEGKTNEWDGHKPAVRIPPVTQNAFMQNPEFSKMLGDFHDAARKYADIYQSLVTIADTQNPANQVVALRMLLKATEIGKYIEADADRQGIDSVIDSKSLTEHQKLQALTSFKNSHRENCQKHHPEMTWNDIQGSACAVHPFAFYPPCKERVIWVEDAIQTRVLPVLRIEQAAETMHPAWDPAAA